MATRLSFQIYWVRMDPMCHDFLTVNVNDIGKITSAPSANIFTNRDYENLLRSLNLRRLSFILYTGERNHFLALLPSVQEKLVEILKSPPGPTVQCEVWLTISRSCHLLISFRSTCACEFSFADFHRTICQAFGRSFWQSWYADHRLLFFLQDC